MNKQSQASQSAVILKVFIDGDWSAHDFVLFLAAIDKIYAALDLSGRISKENPVGISAIRRNRHNALVVKSVSYSSPGSINFQGLGEPIDAIRRILKDVFGGHSLDLEERAVDIAIKEEELRHQSAMNRLEEFRTGISVADETGSLLRAQGFSEKEVQSYLHRGFLQPTLDLARLHDQEKLTGIDDSQLLPPSDERESADSP